jgi:hypothetical protein
MTSKKTLPEIGGKEISQLELATLAAQIIGASHQTMRRFSADAAVRMALDLWNEAGEKLSERHDLSDKARGRKKIVGNLGKALLVGKHFLPELEAEHFEMDHCGLDEFLRFSLGLSEKSDRMKWLGAFLDKWSKKAHGYPVWVSYKELASRGFIGAPGRVAITPEEIERRIKDMESHRRISKVEPLTPPRKLSPHEVIEGLRKNGIKEPAFKAEAFRAWRLTMKSHKEEAKEPLSVEEAIFNASKKDQK